MVSYQRACFESSVSWISNKKEHGTVADFLNKLEIFTVLRTKQTSCYVNSCTKRNTNMQRGYVAGNDIFWGLVWFGSVKRETQGRHRRSKE